MPFASRTPGSADILYVMALDNEYGPHLRARITPVMTGVTSSRDAATVTWATAAAKSSAGSTPVRSPT